MEGNSCASKTLMEEHRSKQELYRNQFRSCQNTIGTYKTECAKEFNCAGDIFDDVYDLLQENTKIN